jgi:hypothetical protein
MVRESRVYDAHSSSAEHEVITKKEKRIMDGGQQTASRQKSGGCTLQMETESSWRRHSQTNKQTVGTPIRKEPLSKIDRATAIQGIFI